MSQYRRAIYVLACLLATRPSLGCSMQDIHYDQVVRLVAHDIRAT